jgi:hypothetical protein
VKNFSRDRIRQITEKTFSRLSLLETEGRNQEDVLRDLAMILARHIRHIGQDALAEAVEDILLGWTTHDTKEAAG